MGKKSRSTVSDRKHPDADLRNQAPRATNSASRHVLPLAGIIGFALLVYSNSFGAPFLFDNNEIILQDTRVHAATAEHIQKILAGPYWEIKLINLYRPLTTLSYLFNYAVLGNGTTPAGYHWINFGLHAVNMALVYALGMAIFEAIPAAVGLSLLWGIHPVLTESVTNIVGRADLLAAFGVLAGLLAYDRALRSSGRTRVAWAAALGLATTVGMFSKESAIVVLALLVLYDLAFPRGVGWRERVPLYASAAIPCGAYFAARVFALRSLPYTPVPFTDNPLVGAGFWASRLTAVRIIGKYLALLVWPAHLSCDYSYNAIPLFGAGGWKDFQAILALLVCLSAAVAAGYFFRRDRRIFFGIGFFFVCLAPTANIAIEIGTVMAERFLYLPAIGFLICVLQAVMVGLKRRAMPRSGPRWIAATVVALLAFRTYQRNDDWTEDKKLWASAVEAAPDSYKARVMEAVTWERDGGDFWGPAVGDMDRAMGILNGLPDDKNTWRAYSDAGEFYLALGDRITRGNSPVGLSQTDAGFWYRKALDELLRCERIAKLVDREHARAYAERGEPGLTFMPSHVYFELGKAYRALGYRPDALAAFERGRTLESDPDLLEQLAAMYQQNGDLRAAAGALVEALYMDPNRPAARSRLVELYGRIDPAGCAVVGTGGSRDLNPECPLVHTDICTASRAAIGHYLQRGLKADAARSLEIARQEVGCKIDQWW